MAYDKLIELRQKLQECKLLPESSLIWLEEYQRHKIDDLWTALGKAKAHGIDIVLPIPGKEYLFSDDGFISMVELIGTLYKKFSMIGWGEREEAESFVKHNRLTGDDLNAYIDVICANIDIASEFDALDPEKERTSLRATWRHRRALRKTGLHDGTVTKEKADAYFAQYGTTYETLLHDLNIDYTSQAVQQVFEALNRWRHDDALLIFPLRGQLFNYYIARGMAEEMRRYDPTVNLRIRTMQTARPDYQTESARTEYARARFLIAQAGKLLRTTPREIVIVDYRSEGVTQQAIKDAFATYNRAVTTLCHVDEHQIIHTLGLRIVPGSLLVKTAIGQAIPHSNAAQMQGNPTWYKMSSSPIQEVARAEFVREMLFIFGRIYYHLRRRY